MPTIVIYFAFVIIQCLVVALSVFFTSYFQEKGKNTASKEDITKITQLIEEVRLSFSKQAEELKAELQFYNNVHTGIVTEERNAIAEYHMKHALFLNVLRDVTLGESVAGFKNDVAGYYRIIVKFREEYAAAQSIFRLFIADENLHQVEKAVWEITFKFNVSMNNYISAVSSLQTNSKKREAHEILDLQAKEIERFHKELTVNVKELRPVIEHFRELCREHINNKISGRRM